MKVFNEFEAPETVAYFKTMYDFYQKGYIRKDAATVMDFNADLSAGKIFASTKSLKPGKDAEMTLSTGHPWVQVEITPPVISNRDTTGSMQAVSSTSENPELALQVLEMFNTHPELNNLINFGIEDTHYSKISDNVIMAGQEMKSTTQERVGCSETNLSIIYGKMKDPEKWSKFESFNAKQSQLKHWDSFLILPM